MLQECGIVERAAGIVRNFRLRPRQEEGENSEQVHLFRDGGDAGRESAMESHMCSVVTWSCFLQINLWSKMLYENAYR